MLEMPQIGLKVVEIGSEDQITEAKIRFVAHSDHLRQSLAAGHNGIKLLSTSEQLEMICDVAQRATTYRLGMLPLDGFANSAVENTVLVVCIR